jgi:hypothetical protein
MAAGAMRRRSFLKRVGIGAGAIVVVGSRGLARRIADQSVQPSDVDPHAFPDVPMVGVPTALTDPA